MVLDEELGYFEAHRDGLVQNHPEGQFALIHGKELLGVFANYSDAFSAGIQAVGNRPFLVTPIAQRPPENQIPALAVGMIGARS